MPTAQRRSRGNRNIGGTPPQPPADQGAQKAKPTEFERAQAAYDKAKAKTDKSTEKVTKAQEALGAAQAQLAIDKRTSDYLYMHPALAEARENGGQFTVHDEHSVASAPVGQLTGEGEAHGVSGVITDEQADAALAGDDQPEAPVDPFAPEEEAKWEEAAPAAPVTDPFAGDDNAERAPNSYDPTNPFGG